MKPWFDHPNCQQRVSCEGCRTSRPYRETLFAKGWVDDSDFACPYGFTAEDYPERQTPPIAAGPGTDLKRLLSKLGITPTAGCQCNAIARRMDAMGVEGCREHFEQIVDEMTREAIRRGWKFPGVVRVGISTLLATVLAR